MTPTRLMILAGYRGAGKSSLLMAARHAGLPLFGLDYIDAFATTQPPNAEREMDVPFDQAIAQGNWLSCVHIPPLLRLHPKPAVAVIHWDFISLLKMTDAARKVGRDDLMDMLADPAKAQRLMAPQADALHQLVDSYDHTVVNTLICLWPQLCRRMRARAYQPETLSHALFDPANPHARRVHANLYRTWLASLNPIICKKLRTRWDQRTAVMSAR